jgi:hypothetical protein
MGDSFPSLIKRVDVLFKSFDRFFYINCLNNLFYLLYIFPLCNEWICIITTYLHGICLGNGFSYNYFSLFTTPLINDVGLELKSNP